MWAEEKAQKDEFAAEWLRQPDPFKAALSIVGPANVGRALQISSQWVLDSYVLTRQKELIEEFGEDYFLPSKAVIARKVLEVHENAKTSFDKLAALKLYAEVMGHISKPDNNKASGGLIAIPITEMDAKL